MLPDGKHKNWISWNWIMLLFVLILLYEFIEENKRDSVIHVALKIRRRRKTYFWYQNLKYKIIKNVQKIFIIKTNFFPQFSSSSKIFTQEMNFTSIFRTWLWKFPPRLQYSSAKIHLYALWVTKMCLSTLILHINPHTHFVQWQQSLLLSTPQRLSLIHTTTRRKMFNFFDESNNKLLMWIEKKSFKKNV